MRLRIPGRSLHTMLFHSLFNEGRPTPCGWGLVSRPIKIGQCNSFCEGVGGCMKGWWVCGVYSERWIAGCQASEGRATHIP